MNSRSSQLFNLSSSFSTRAIIHLSFLSIWLWSLVLAKNAWNAVLFEWKFLCVAFADFSWSMQRNWKPFSAIVLEFISDVSPFSGVARGVWWSMKGVLCFRVSLNLVSLVLSWISWVLPGFVFFPRRFGTCLWRSACIFIRNTTKWWHRHCSFLSKVCSAVNVIYWATCFFAKSAKGSTLIGFVFNNMFLRFLQRRLYVLSSTCSSPLVSSFFFFLIFSFVNKGKDLLGVPPAWLLNFLQGRLVAGLNLLDCSGFEELASLLVQKFDLTEQKFECSSIISGGGGRSVTLRKLKWLRFHKTSMIQGCIVPTLTAISL